MSRLSMRLPPYPLSILIAAACLMGAGMQACYTEVGNPGKTQEVNATFSIDYADASAPLPKMGADKPKAAIDTPSVRILHFYFNVVEVNYRNADSLDGRIWKVPDSMGRRIDFAGRDSTARLPAVQVPLSPWILMKLESRIPEHDTILPDTLDFQTFPDRGYIKGTWESGGNITPKKSILFLCQLPDDYRINLVYYQELLETWRHGSVYDLEFIFYATKWMMAVNLPDAVTYLDKHGQAVALIDLEHNPDLYQLLKASFFKSFNSSKVWKENPG